MIKYYVKLLSINEPVQGAACEKISHNSGRGNGRILWVSNNWTLERFFHFRFLKGSQIKIHLHFNKTASFLSWKMNTCVLVFFYAKVFERESYRSNAIDGKSDGVAWIILLIFRLKIQSDIVAQYWFFWWLRIVNIDSLHKSKLTCLLKKPGHNHFSYEICFNKICTYFLSSKDNTDSLSILFL